MVIKISKNLEVLNKEIKHTLEIRKHIHNQHKENLNILEKYGQCAPSILAYAIFEVEHSETSPKSSKEQLSDNNKSNASPNNREQYNFSPNS